jgi:hypothetical protein
LGSGLSFFPEEKVSSKSPRKNKIKETENGAIKMKMSEAGYLLSSDELMVLASMTGSGSFLGFDYESPPDDAKKLEELWEKTKPSLEKKNYIFDGLNGSMIIDKQLMSYIEACTTPDFFITLITKENGREAASFLYVSGDIFIKMDTDLRDKTDFILTPMRTQSRFNLTILDMMEFNEEYNAKGFFELTASSKDVEAIIKEDNAVLRKMDFIRDSGLSEEAFFDMTYALRQCDNIRTLILMGLKGEEKIYRDVLCYSGGKRLWRLANLEDGKGLKIYSISIDSYTETLNEVLGEIKITAR